MVGIFALIMIAMRSSDVAKEAVGQSAVERRSWRSVSAAPIGEGWFVGGSINVSAWFGRCRSSGSDLRPER